MAEIIDIRNPNDLTATYDQIEIQGSANSDMSSPTTLTSSLAIDTSTANDLSTGYTSYLDSTGYNYYRFRYKVSASAAVSDWSDIFAANTTVMHTRFRNRMHDTNSANYYFTNAQVTDILANAINKLYPASWNEVIDETLSSSGTEEKYTFPVGIFRVNQIELIDSAGEVQSRPLNYQIVGRKIIFTHPLTSGYTLRLYADKKFSKLGEVPEEFDSLILDLMTLEAYQSFEADRSRYFKYTTVTNPEGGNLPSLKSVVERYEAITKLRLNELRRVRKPSDMKLT